MKITIPKSEIVLKSGETILVDREKGKKVQEALHSDATHITLSEQDRTLQTYEIKEVRQTTQQVEHDIDFSRDELDETENRLEELKENNSPVEAVEKYIAENGGGEIVNGRLHVNPVKYKRLSERIRQLRKRQAKQEYAQEKKLQQWEELKDQIANTISNE